MSPYLVTRTAVRHLVPAAVVTALVAVPAAVAQHTAGVAEQAATGVRLETYPWAGHVLAMVLIGAAAVAAAVALVRAGSAVAAGLTLMGVVVGPMLLVAAPVRDGLVREDSGDTVAWWHVVVAVVLFVALTAWTGSAARGPGSHGTRPGAVLFAASVAVAFLVAQRWPGTDSGPVGTVPLIGWALLTGGLVVAAAAGGTRGAVLRMLLVVAAFAVMAAAYGRDGGWPGVAGWEYLGMESPLVLCRSVVVLVLLATPAGALAAAARAQFERSYASQPASVRNTARW